MPFRSEAQRRLLWAKHPDVARKWAHEYPNQKHLPYHKSDVNNSHNRQRKKAVRFVT